MYFFKMGHKKKELRVNRNSCNFFQEIGELYIYVGTF